MLRRFASLLLAIPDWLYGPRAAGFDLGLGFIAAAWASLMILNPGYFDRGSFVGLDWMPDEAWITLLIVMSVTHALGLLWPLRRALRVSASLLSSWTWFFVSISLNRVEVGTGVFAYGLFGAVGLTGAIFLAGLPRSRI